MYIMRFTFAGRCIRLNAENWSRDSQSPAPIDTASKASWPQSHSFLFWHDETTRRAPNRQSGWTQIRSITEAAFIAIGLAFGPSSTNDQPQNGHNRKHSSCFAVNRINIRSSSTPLLVHRTRSDDGRTQRYTSRRWCCKWIRVLNCKLQIAIEDMIEIECIFNNNNNNE